MKRLILRAGDAIDMTLGSVFYTGFPRRFKIVRVTPHYTSVKMYYAPISARLLMLSDRMGSVIRITDNTARSRIR